MALTAGTVWPMAPFGGRDQHAAPVMEFGATASETVKKGDVLTVASGRASRDASPTIDLTLGIAAGPKTTTGTVTEDDVVLVHPAFANMMFEGNAVGAAGTDVTGVYATDLLARNDVLESDIAGTTDEIFVIDTGGTTNAAVRTLRYGRQKDGTIGRASGVGKTNPRVVFVFCSSVFSPLS